MTRTRIVLGLLAAVAVVVAVALASDWTPDRSVAELSARWASPPSQFLSIDGMTVHVRDEGGRDDPEPIVLLHGTSASLQTWDGWVAGLADHRRVIRADLPGYGLTGPTPDGKYDMATYTHFVIALMDELGVRQAVLAGNSLGGYIAWKTAVDYPDRVARLVLVDAAGYDFRSESVPLAFKMARNPVLAPVMAHLLSRGIVESSVRNVYGDPSKVTPALVERYYELTLRTGNRRAAAERFRQLQNGEFEDQVQRVTEPTLILWGAKDRLIPLESAVWFHRDIPASQLVVFDQLGHVPQEEAPVATVAAVRAFLGN
jgi:pimeloyl-ACP methyl ester carboxylesterase